MNYEKNYEEKYKEALERAKKWLYAPNSDKIPTYANRIIEGIFPELKESKAEWVEKIRKELKDYLGKRPLKKLSESDAVNQWIAWLEKQGNSPIKWNKNTKDNKPQKNHSVLMQTTHGIAEGEWQGEHWHQYRWAALVRDTDVLSWMELSDLEKQSELKDKGEISDGYHTFNELYYYRMLYNAAFFNMLPKEWVHKSKRHNDGEECFGGGWFIVMAYLPTGQISNHYELKDWDLFQIPEKEVADKWDGHTPQEAADRLHKYLLEKQSEQSHWKPTEEQLQTIHAQLNEGAVTYPDDKRVLTTLYEDLMKITTQEEKQGGQKEINLVEILKHYPRETELYSPLYGKLWLAEIDEECEIITCYKHPLGEGCTRAILEQEDTVSFYSNGTTGLPDFSVSKDCMLFLYDIEKQGEQKLIDKVEPKFKVGDWIVYEGLGTYKVVEIHEGWYSVIDINDRRWSVMFERESLCHIWTIEDAKAGDVLSWDDKCIALFKNIYDKESFNSCGFVGHCMGVFESGLSYHAIEGAHPATKEQRDLLFKKMKESGYEWDTENKELKKIEQKYTNIEPKFKVGDWCIDNEDGTIFQIVKVLDNSYMYKTNEGKEYSCSHYSLEIDAKLWTIQDAKDGDVLVYEGEIFIIKFYVLWHKIVYHCCYDGKNLHKYSIYDSWRKEDFDKVHPATKEQCDTLFTKMKEAGYEWDADKKELKKIESKTAELPKGEDNDIDGLYAAIDIMQKTLGKVEGYQTDDGILEHECAISAVKKLYEQKSAWSEEDEKMLNDAIGAISAADYYTYDDKQEIENWLKSLKDRI